MISCSEAVRQLWEYLDGDLPESDQGRVRGHLDLCRRCCGEAEFTASLQELLRSVQVCELPDDVEQHLVSFLHELQQEAT